MFGIMFFEWSKFGRIAFEIMRRKSFVIYALRDHERSDMKSHRAWRKSYTGRQLKVAYMNYSMYFGRYATSSRRIFGGMCRSSMANDASPMIVTSLEAERKVVKSLVASYEILANVKSVNAFVTHTELDAFHGIENSIDWCYIAGAIWPTTKSILIGDERTIDAALAEINAQGEAVAMLYKGKTPINVR